MRVRDLGLVETRWKDLAFVREGRDYLKLVTAALPGTAEAGKAQALLKAAE